MVGNTMTVALTSADLLSITPLRPVSPIRPPTAKGSLKARRRSRPATLAENSRVGPWKVERELGRGGMAAVYAVSHTRFGKRAALKIAHRSVIGPEFTPATFLREARIVHLVNHPGVPDVFATGSYDGRPYLAMERLAGETLGNVVDTGSLSRQDAISYLLELCEILDAAHSAGVVHRDLKLDNVFVQTAPGPGGRRIRLLDWGVARVLGEDDPMRGMIAGTLTYVAPEQVRGEEITPAADIYSLAVLAYHTLLGGPPFKGDHELDLIKQHLHAVPPAPASLWPEIPPQLAKLLTAMLDKDPAMRPALDEVKIVLRDASEELEPKPQAAPFAKGFLKATVAIGIAIATAISLLSA